MSIESDPIEQSWHELYTTWEGLPEAFRHSYFTENPFDTDLAEHIRTVTLPHFARNLFGEMNRPVILTDLGSSTFPTIRETAIALAERQVYTNNILVDPGFTHEHVRRYALANFGEDPFANVQCQEASIPQCFSRIEVSDITTASHVLNYIDAADIPSIFRHTHTLVSIVDSVNRGNLTPKHPYRFRSIETIIEAAQSEGFGILHREHDEIFPDITALLFIRL